MEIKEQVDKLATAWEQFKSVNDQRLAEIEKKGSADVLLTEQVNKINAALDEQKAKVELIERAASRPSLGAEGKGSEADAEHKNAFINYVRKGIDGNLGELQSKALSVGSDIDGGYLVPRAMSSQIIKVINESSPLRQLATVETISTDSLDVLEDRGLLTSGGWTGEQSSRSDTATPTFGLKNIPTHEMYAQPKATQKLIDDANTNIEAWIGGKIAEIFAIDEATAFISGNGVSKPRGILGYTPAADASFAWGNPSYIASGTSAAVTADGLISTLYALKDAYSANASWLMRRATVGNVRLLKDTTNQYIWQPSLQAGTPDLLLGKPIYQAADMEAVAASSYSVAFGDWKKAYTIVDRIGIRILRDNLTDKPFIKFYATKRVGGNVTNFEAYKLLKLATS